jgi:hypothetical protein
LVIICGDAAIDQKGDAPADGSDHARQGIQRGGRAIELPAAMVGNDHPVDPACDRLGGLLGMKNAFQQQGTLPHPAQPLDVAPGHRRIEQACDLGGHRADVGRGARARIIGEVNLRQPWAHA